MFNIVYTTRYIVNPQILVANPRPITYNQPEKSKIERKEEGGLEMNKVLVIGGDVVSRVEAYNQLVDEHSVVGVGDVRSAGGMLDWADVVVLLDATNDEAHALPRSYRGRAVLVTSYPELFMQSAELGYLGADRNNDQLASLVALALERITSPKSRVVV